MLFIMLFMLYVLIITPVFMHSVFQRKAHWVYLYYDEMRYIIELLVPLRYPPTDCSFIICQQT